MKLRPFTALSRLAARLAGGPVWRGGPSDIVATLGPDGVILAVSASARDVIGAAGDLAGRSLLDFVARADRSGVRAALAEAGAADADPAGCAVRFSLLRVRRAAVEAELILRPAGRRRLDALIRERADAAPARAGETGPAQDHADLMADLAHEMKTPLNAIMGFADAMRAETFGPLGADDDAKRKYAEYVGHIHASGAHLTALIGSVQEVARMKAGQYRIERAPADPAAIARDCAAMVRGAAEAAGLDFRLDLAADLPNAELDARAVRQILINLLSNAVKFTEAGSVTLSVRTRGEAVEFAVRDTGVGMNKVVLAKLGGRWSDTRRNGVRGTGGSGLGLSLAFELARLHGAALTIDSIPGEGTTARFCAPLKAGAAEQAPSEDGDGARPAAQPEDIQSQLDRVNAFRREHAGRAA